MSKIYTIREQAGSKPLITVDPCLASHMRAKGWHVVETEIGDNDSNGKLVVGLVYGLIISIGILCCVVWLANKVWGIWP